MKFDRRPFWWVQSGQHLGKETNMAQYRGQLGALREVSGRMSLTEISMSDHGIHQVS